MHLNRILPPQFFHQFRSAFVGRHPSKSLAPLGPGAPPDVAPPEHAPHHQADHPPVAVRRRAGADPLGKSRPARARAGGRHRYAPRAPQCRRRAQRHVLGVPRGRAGRTRLARRLPSGLHQHAAAVSDRAAPRVVEAWRDCLARPVGAPSAGDLRQADGVRRAGRAADHLGDAEPPRPPRDQGGGLCRPAHARRKVPDGGRRRRHDKGGDRAGLAPAGRGAAVRCGRASLGAPSLLPADGCAPPCGQAWRRAIFGACCTSTRVACSRSW